MIGLDGKPIEVQVRTHEMHRRAEYGIAAHWGYKEKPGRPDRGPTTSAKSGKETGSVGTKSRGTGPASGDRHRPSTTAASPKAASPTPARRSRAGRGRR